MSLIDRIEVAFNSELTKRLLIRYFSDRGFADNFDKRVYPPLLQDLVEMVPELAGKIELVPSVVEIDPTTGFARLAWNLFVLGNQRMFLGETEHAELPELARQLEQQGDKTITTGDADASRKTRSARDIVSWVVRMLGRSEAGLIRTSPDTVPAQTGPSGLMGGTQAGQFFRKPSN